MWRPRCEYSSPREAPRLQADRRRALELLPSSRDGATEAIMIAHGFTIEDMVELVSAGLTTANAERVVAREDYRGGGGRHSP